MFLPVIQLLRFEIGGHTDSQVLMPPSFSRRIHNYYLPPWMKDRPAVYEMPSLRRLGGVINLSFKFFEEISERHPYLQGLQMRSTQMNDFSLSTYVSYLHSILNGFHLTQGFLLPYDSRIPILAQFVCLKYLAGFFWGRH